jgi:citrate lyase subunit beta/citryl-CoA lyase
MIRSFLHTPGDRPELVRNAAALTGADRPDAIIVDLDESLTVAARRTARESLAELVSECVSATCPPLFVRVDAGPDQSADLAVVSSLPVAGIVLPKATIAAVGDAARLVDDFGGEPTPILAMIETAQGILDAAAIARHPRVSWLGIGESSLMSDLRLRVSSWSAELASLRMRVVVAAAAAGIDLPVGSTFAELNDEEGLRSSTAALRDCGFGSRVAIDASQVAVMNEVFTPTAEELAAAQELVALLDSARVAGSGAAIGSDGRAVDPAVARAARRLLDLPSK